MLLLRKFFKHDKRNTIVPRKLKEIPKTQPRKFYTDVTKANYGIAYNCFHYRK